MIDGLLNTSELHILVQWGTAIHVLDKERFSEAEQQLLDEAKAVRNERYPFNVFAPSQLPGYPGDA